MQISAGKLAYSAYPDDLGSYVLTSCRRRRLGAGWRASNATRSDRQRRPWLLGVNRRFSFRVKARVAVARGRDPAGFCLDDDQQRYQGPRKGGYRIWRFTKSGHPRPVRRQRPLGRPRPMPGSAPRKANLGPSSGHVPNSTKSAFQKHADLQGGKAPLPGFEPGFPDW